MGHLQTFVSDWYADKTGFAGFPSWRVPNVYML